MPRRKRSTNYFPHKNTFIDEDYFAEPDPNKEYYYSYHAKCTLMTKLMKWCILSFKTPLDSGYVYSLSQAELDAKNSVGMTALGICCQNYYDKYCDEHNTIPLSTIKLLLDVKASIHIPDNYNDDSFCNAIEYSLRADIIELMISYKANVNINSHWTPLHYAIEYNNYDAAKLLLQHKADVNIKSDLNETPLSEYFWPTFGSVSKKDIKFIKLLLHKSDLKIGCGRDNVTVITICCMNPVRYGTLIPLLLGSNRLNYSDYFNTINEISKTVIREDYFGKKDTNTTKLCIQRTGRIKRYLDEIFYPGVLYLYGKISNELIYEIYIMYKRI